MVHLMWSGKGWVVPALAFGASLAAGFITFAISGEAYWEAHRWPFGIAMLAAAPPCWFIGRRLGSEPPRRLIDAKTGEEVVLRQTHTCLFIPVMWWAPVLTAAGLFAFYLELVK